MEIILSALKKKHNTDDIHMSPLSNRQSVFFRRGNGTSLQWYFIKENDKSLMRDEIIHCYADVFLNNYTGDILNFILIDTEANREMIEQMFFDTRYLPQFEFYNSDSDTFYFRKQRKYF